MKNIVNTIKRTLSKTLQGLIGLVLSIALYIVYDNYNGSFLKIIPLIGICAIVRTWHVCNVKRSITEEIQEELDYQERKVG